MDKLLLVYTMIGCPHCVDFKKLLDENQIDYYERDVDEYSEEYDLFVEITGNEYVPSFMIVESPEENPNSLLFTPERDFNDLNEGIEIIKEHLRKRSE
jgi:glutaredoxin